MEENTFVCPPADSCPLLKAADLIMDPAGGEVRRDSRRLILEEREFQLLEFLLRNKNRIVSRTDLLREVWKHEVSIHTMDARISSLRKKIDTSFPIKLIYTISRKGYVLVDPK